MSTPPVLPGPAGAPNPQGAQALPAPRLSPLCDLRVDVGDAIDIGATPLGRRRVIPILGGVVRQAAGADCMSSLNGRVVAAGADFQLISGEAEGLSCATLEARYVLALEDGAHVYVHNSALRVASLEDAVQLMKGKTVPDERVYFRCQPRFETADPRHAWLMRQQFVGTGRRLAGCVLLSFFRVC